MIDGLRTWTSVPIIVLSARNTETEKVAALDAGANDYMTKPFGIAEFMARLRAALRANHPTEHAPVLETANFTLDLAAKRARRGTRDVHLTATEWQIINLLACSPGRLITLAQLLEQVWGLKRHQEQLRSRVPGGDPTQARTRPRQPTLLPHRAPLRHSLRPARSRSASPDGVLPRYARNRQ